MPNVHLTQPMEAYVKGRIKSGAYANVSVVVRAGMKHVVFFAGVMAADNTPVILRIVHQPRNMPALTCFEALGG